MQEYIVRVFEEGEFYGIKEEWIDKESGKIHRINGPALTYWDGSQYYYINGEKHREGGPAVIYADGYQYYYKNGEFHREDGPAVIRSDGSEEYWIEGKRYTKEQFLKKTQKHKISIDGKEIELDGIEFEKIMQSLKED